jgi:tubulin polyglutamylase TTLL6/13
VQHPDQVPEGERYIAQKYLAKPFLLDGMKFDLRIYVLVAGCDPLRIYVYKEGLARLATAVYSAPSKKNISNTFMHLTNYAVNKHNPDFVENISDNTTETGHKLSLSYTMDLLAKMGVDTPQLWRNIKRIAVKTLCSAQPKLSHLYKAARGDEYQYNLCFEVLGLDIILDHKAKPWLLEVNYTPSFATGSKLDLEIKGDLIRDTLVLLNQSPESRREIVKTRQREMEARILTGKRPVLSREERDREQRTLQHLRDQFCSENLGNFDQAYPPTDPEMDEPFEEFISAAQEEYSNATGNKKSTVLPKETECNQLETKIVRFTQGKPSLDRTKSLMVQQRNNNRPSTGLHKKVEMEPIKTTLEYNINLQQSQKISQTKPPSLKSMRPDSVDLQSRRKGGITELQTLNFQTASPQKERSLMKYTLGGHNDLIELRQRNYAEEYVARKQGYYTKIMESVNEVKAIIENFPSNLATALQTKKQSPVNQFAEFMKNQFPISNKAEDELFNRNFPSPTT